MNDILPEDKLTLSERCLYAALAVLLMGSILMAIGFIIHLPWLLAAAAVLAICFEFRKRRGRPKPTSGIHGTARFADEHDIAGFTGCTRGLIVGTLPGQPRRQRRPNLIEILGVPKSNIARMREMLGRYVAAGMNTGDETGPELIRVPSSDRFSHVACYLTTGAGKTWRMVIPNLLNDPDNAVVYDPSGETYRETADHRRKEFGHETPVINPFGICGDRYSDRLNPLEQVEPGDRGCFDYCNHLAHALVVERPESRQEPIWHAGSIAMTAFLLHAITLNGGERHRSLLSLGEMLNGKRLHELAESLMDHPDSALRRRAQQALNFKGRTLDSLLATMTAEHGWMDSPAFGDVLSGSTFSMRSLFERKMTLYIVIPGNRALESQPFVRALLTAILYAGFDAGPDIRRPPVRFYLDEAATLGKLDLLMTLYTQGRKFGLRSVNFFQSVAQVAEIVGTPDKIQTFRSQMTGGELFKPHDLATSKEVSEWIGNTTVETVSTSSQRGTNGGWTTSQGQHPSTGKSGGWNESTSTTVSETGVPLIRPEELLQLGPRQAIFLQAGMPPLKLNILDAGDVRRCAPRVGIADPHAYLWRVRWYAVLIFFCMALPATCGGMLLLATGAMHGSPPRAEQAVRPEVKPVAAGQSLRPRGVRTR